MGICESILWKLEMSLIRPLVHCEVSLLENLDGYLVSVNPMPPLPRGCPPLAFFFFFGKLHLFWCGWWASWDPLQCMFCTIEICAWLDARHNAHPTNG